jgi:hypothetical protein
VGTSSSLDLSQVTSLAGGYGVYLDAYEGGEIDLSSLPEIANGEEIIWETGDPGLPDLSQNGNIKANPLFVSREEGNYQP